MHQAILILKAILLSLNTSMNHEIANMWLCLKMDNNPDSLYNKLSPGCWGNLASKNQKNIHSLQAKIELAQAQLDTLEQQQQAIQSLFL